MRLLATHESSHRPIQSCLVCGNLWAVKQVCCGVLYCICAQRAIWGRVSILVDVVQIGQQERRLSRSQLSQEALCAFRQGALTLIDFEWRSAQDWVIWDRQEVKVEGMIVDCFAELNDLKVDIVLIEDGVELD